MVHNALMSIQRFLLIGAMAMTQTGTDTTSGADAVTCRIRDEVLHRINPRLFGQFMERPSWGETGPEGALTPGTRRLQSAVLNLLWQMEIPILRFPGGTDVDYMDFRDMISNVPGRGPERPVSVGHKGHKVTNSFGYDEFLEFRESAKAEAILVVNFRDALLKKRPLAEHALHIAGLVAYCNAPVGAELPRGMPNWPALRARNGHPRPYGVKHWQIGNETWAFLKDLRKQEGDNGEAWHAECLVAVARAMLAVDPGIELVLDGQGGTFGAAERARKELGEKVSHLVFHSYTPWAIREVRRDGETVGPAELSAADIWRAWVATPHIDDAGLAVFTDGLIDTARRDGFKIAVTEWNWNGWWSVDNRDELALDSIFAKGVGAAGFLHALMRAGDVIDIGCQSMLVGSGWGIHAVRADPEGKRPPYFYPTGQATMLYTLHHGPEMLKLDCPNLPVYEQPYRMGGIGPRPKVARLDPLATRSDEAVFLHAIHRGFDRPLTLRVDLSAVGPLTGEGTHHLLTGRLRNEPRRLEDDQPGKITADALIFEPPTLTVTLPPRSVSAIELRRKR